jgi:hypothetical protein
MTTKKKQAQTTQTTQTPELIEPALPIEVTLKFRGQLTRQTLRRQTYAECMEPGCPNAWAGTSAVAASGNHALGSHHRVRQFYQAVYEMRPTLANNPLATIPDNLPPMTPSTIEEMSQKLQGL